MAVQSTQPPHGTETLRATPYYLVLRTGHDCYVLDSDRKLIRRGASQLLLAFARKRSVARSLDGAAWDAFSQAHKFSSDERSHLCMYSLIAGRETPHQLELLTRL